MRTLAEWLELQQSVHPREHRPRARARRAGGARARRRRSRTARSSRSAAPTARARSSRISKRCCARRAFAPACSRRRTSFATTSASASMARKSPDDELVAAFERIEAARGDTTLTFFEFNALAALPDLRASGSVDVAVLEVGLGGRLDAVNMIDADVAVVVLHRPRSSRLARRHARGHRPREGGHLPRGPAGGARLAGHAGERVRGHRGDRRAARRRRARFHAGACSASGWNYRGLEASLRRPAAVRRSPARFSTGTLPRRSPPWKRCGCGQALDREASQRGAARRAACAGRFQIVPGPVEWILDVAHNEPAARVFASHLRRGRARAAPSPSSAFSATRTSPAIGATAASRRRSLDPVHAGRAARPARRRSWRGALALDDAAVDARGVGRRRVASGEARRRVPGDRVVVFGSLPYRGLGAAVASDILSAATAVTPALDSLTSAPMVDSSREREAHGRGHSRRAASCCWCRSC